MHSFSHPAPSNRREMLLRCCNGFGAVALTGLFGKRLAGAQDPVKESLPHFQPKVKNVIFLYMDGGPSQVDTFDPKPRLDREHGQPIGMKIPATQFDDVGTVLKSHWLFQKHGQSGIPISALFPKIAEQADNLTVIRSMVSQFPEHTSANYFLHTGYGQQGRPSMGSWLTYGLGSECDNLPGFVVLNGGLIPPGGLDNFNSGFLPASFQGSIFRSGEKPVANIVPQEENPSLQKGKLKLLAELESKGQEEYRKDPTVEAAIANYELAFRMQAAVPDLMDMSGESETIRDLYGLNAEDKNTRTYGSLCLLARRLVERGVRFVELTCPNVGHDRWDQHSNLKKGHEDNARAVDQPIAALLQDLKGTGLLAQTLVVWAGEFGRTPMAQGSNGRDHNPHGFSIWMAGAGLKPGTIYGRTDDYGYFAIENKVTIHDLHATMLHLLGIDHKRLTFYFSGRDMRLTDVHGELVEGILA